MASLMEHRERALNFAITQKGAAILSENLSESNFTLKTTKIRPDLTLNGARYEYVSVPKAGRMKYSFGDDKDNIERVRFAGPKFSGAFRKTWRGDDSVIRGGYGMFHGGFFNRCSHSLSYC